MTKKRVCYIFPTSHHYRAPFHEALRLRLETCNIDYKVVYCEPGEENRKKCDTVDIAWGCKVPCTSMAGGLRYQHGMQEALKSDLIIVQQENSLILNYFLNILSIIGLKKVAYFGHGRNFQARNRDSLAERWKRFWATKVDWWFAYTEASKDHVSSLGFPEERVTVFNNAVDTSKVKDLVKTITPDRLMIRRAELGLTSGAVGIFVGGLYADKRLEFLVEATDLIRASVPDFVLLVVGGGEQLQLIHDLAAARPWIKVLGPRFGADKVELMLLSKLFMMPGLVGLAVVDAGAASLPTITTAFPYHSPEIAYIKSGENGLIVEDWQNPQAYADSVITLLLDASRLEQLKASAEKIADDLTIEAMADRFAQGVIKALSE